MLTKVRVDLLLDEDAIQFLKEEAERRNAAPVGPDVPGWTWRELAKVRASILLDDWTREMKSHEKLLATARSVLEAAPTSEVS